MSVALVAVLVAPLRLGGATGLTATPSEPTAAERQATSRERQVEAAYLANIRLGSLPEAKPATAAPPVTYPRNYPDNIRPERKEVTPAEPSGRPPEAI